ncbi:unnamed protein product [Rotaria magnacalcarata]|uniref:Multifunctional fusion protein n=2 Tax=Rotaria magnacalcarata TaxID=392030 RepID=A0A817AE53_9BILA|nr:unnamed protein product [Rotaria magnacalcarata]
MGGKNPKPTIPTSTTSVDVMRLRRRIAQNYLVIWVDGNIDKKPEDCRNTLTQLRAVVSDVNVCTTPEQCLQFLNEMDEGKAFVISSGTLGQSLVNDIHNMSKVDAIYIFCGNKALHGSWTKEWPKIRGVFTSISPICESLKKVALECNHDSISMSFVPKRCTSDAASNDQNLNQLPPTYMYSLIFKDIVLEINDDDAKSLNTLDVYCKKQNIPDIEINELKRKYHQKSPVWWYTCEMFLYGMLNYGLRSLDMEAMSKLGFFIRSLHLQLKQLHQEQSVNFQKSFTVYRGQGLSKEDFQNLLDSKGGLLSFNNFLSTSMKEKVAMEFVERAMQKNQDTIGVMFIMTIDQIKIATSITPFAMIDDHSALPQEKEILFTMHTVFRVVDIKQAPKNNRLWEVQLAITDESDPQLSALTNSMKKEVSGRGWYRMGKLMLRVGQFDQAEELYSELLENVSSDSDRAHIYHQLGRVKWQQGQYEKEIAFYEKALIIYEKTLSEDDVSLTSIYSNIALAYKNVGHYSKALEFNEKSIKIQEIFLPPNHPNLDTSYNNIGLVYNNMGDYSKAFEFYEKSHQILEISLPQNHPNLASSYNNIGLVYNNMGDYSKSLEFYEKSIKIKETSLPPNHPNLAISYNNIGQVYNNMGDYSKALEFYEKSHQILEISLPQNHPNLATSYNDIGLVYNKISYNNIGQVYNNMGDYSKSLEFYEKSLTMKEKVLHPAHPDLGTSYNNIGLLYDNMGEYFKALSYLEKSLDICRKSLPPTHPHTKIVLNAVERVKEKL